MSERILTVDHGRIRTEEFSCNTSRIGNDEEGVSGDIGYSVRLINQDDGDYDDDFESLQREW